jgi:hypothetical protein
VPGYAFGKLGSLSSDWLTGEQLIRLKHPCPVLLSASKERARFERRFNKIPGALLPELTWEGWQEYSRSIELEPDSLVGHWCWLRPLTCDRSLPSTANWSWPPLHSYSYRGLRRRGRSTRRSKGA